MIAGRVCAMTVAALIAVAAGSSLMAVEALDASRADHIYRIGPETLAAASFAVVTGPVSRYTKQIVEASQPGPDGFPLRWTVSGRLEPPQIIKGRPPTTDVVPFIRQEQSGMLPQPATVAAWERDLGDLGPADEALLFFLGDPARPSLKVVPSRDPATGLAALVRRAVVIQAMPDPAQRLAAWLAYLAAAPSDEARQASLRALVASGAAWPQLAPALEALAARADVTPGMRAYAAGIVAFGVTNDRWGDRQLEAVDFVCRQFEAAREPWLALHQVLTLKQVLAYTAEGAGDPARVAVRRRIMDALRRRAAAAPLPPELDAQYREIRDSYPGDL